MKYLRIYNGWSQRDLAKLCGLSQVRICKLERGGERMIGHDAGVSPTTAKRIAKVLKWDGLYMDMFKEIK